MRFGQLRALLEDFGFAGRPGRGDHWVFVHPGAGQSVTVDPRRPHVLPVYVRAALRAVEAVQDFEKEWQDEEGGPH